MSIIIHECLLRYMDGLVKKDLKDIGLNISRGLFSWGTVSGCLRKATRFGEFAPGAVIITFSQALQYHFNTYISPLVSNLATPDQLQNLLVLAKTTHNYCAWKRYTYLLTITYLVNISVILTYRRWRKSFLVRNQPT